MSPRGRLIQLLLTVITLFALLLSSNGAAEAPGPADKVVTSSVEDRMGVSVHRGGQNAIEQWQPTADYLNSVFPKWSWIIAFVFILTVLAVFMMVLMRANDQRQKAEQELRQYRDHLVELVHARTADIITMRDQAIAASEAKSAFLSKMSHELRTPLNAIIGYSELLIDDLMDNNKNGNFLGDLKRIKLSGHHLLSIIKEILDITRIEDVSAHLEIEKFKVPKLLDEVLTTIEPLAHENKNTLTVHNSLQFLILESDRFRLQEVLMQVLQNACKYTENGQIKVDIFNETERGTDWLVIVVTDTGIGMTMAQQSKVFQRFVQGDKPISRHFDGLGFGLAISRGYCRTLGGDISFESEVGKGSKFTIRIPTAINDSLPRRGVA